VQCKLLSERATLPAVRAELVKLALHHFLAPEVLGEGPVAYELWCPPGLTEPAAQFFDTWPNKWTEAELATAVDEAKAKYKALSSVDWSAARKATLEDFPRLLKPRKVTGIDIAAMVRATLPIYEAFFEGNIVMKRDELKGYLDSVFAAGNMRQVSDGDARHILDRVQKIPETKRLYLGHGFLCGVRPEFVALLEPDERLRLSKAVMGGVIEIVHIVLSAGRRYCDKIIEAVKRAARYTHVSFIYVAYQLVLRNLLVRVNELVVPGLKLQPGLASYGALDLSGQLGVHIKEFIEEIKPAQEVVALVEADLKRNHSTLALALKELLEFLPEEIVLVGDTRSAFEDEFLFARMAASANTIDSLAKEARARAEASTSESSSLPVGGAEPEST